VFPHPDGEHRLVDHQGQLVGSVHQPDAATDRLAQWWPLKEGFSFGGDRAADIFIEGREGERFFERFADAKSSTLAS
jgi:hypothetical protein